MYDNRTVANSDDILLCNSKLLLLLQAEERKQQALEKENNEQKDTIAILRHKIANSARDFGEVEWKLKDKLNRKTFALTKLQKSHEELSTEHRSLLKRYSAEVDQYRAQIDTMDKELWSLRGQPFSLLNRLQKHEDRLQNTVDTKEKLEMHMEILQEQNVELTRHLQDAIARGNDFKEKMEFLQKGVPPLEKELAKARSSLEFERRDKAGLEKQLFEMSQNVTSLTQRQARVQEIATSKEAQLSGIIRDKEIAELSMSQKLSAKERVVAKLEKKIAVLEGVLTQARESLKQSEAKCDDMTARDQDMLYNYDLICMARKRLLERQIHCVTSLTTDQPGSEALTGALLNMRKVDLSCCALTNEELALFLEKLKYCPFMEELDASSNLLSEEGSIPIADFLASPACKLRRIDLRYNKFSAQALRRFAVALEHNSSLSIKMVLISKDGLVEAMAQPRDVQSSSTSEELKQSESGACKMYTVMVVDMRDNLLGAAIARPDPAGQGLELEGLRKRLPAAGTLRAKSSSNATPKGAEKPIVVANTPKQIQSRRAYRNKLTSAAYAPLTTAPPR